MELIDMDEKTINKIDQLVDKDIQCEYCIYQECCHGITCYGGGVNYPPCADTDIYELIDIESLEDYELENMEE